jgi:hypothetical protein
MEEKFCTYCGAPNTLAAKHQADMDHYEREFAETQQEVLKKSRKAGSLAAMLVVLVIMIVLNIIAGFISANAWQIKYDRRKQEAAKHAEEHIAAINRMIEEKDYISIRDYYYDNDMADGETFEAYSAIVHYAGSLEDLYGTLCNFDAYSFWQSDSPNSSRITYLASDIIELYEDPKNNYYRDEAVTDDKMAIIEDIRHQAEGLLVAYAGFDKEEVGELKNMSKARIEEKVRESLEAVFEEKREAEEAEKAAQAEETESFSVEAFIEQVQGGAGV